MSLGLENNRHYIEIQIAKSGILAEDINIQNIIEDTRCPLHFILRYLANESEVMANQHHASFKTVDSFS